MDELIDHCLREIAFDGDFGSNVTRLRDFINNFFSLHASDSPQNVDDSYCDFFWSVLVQQPSVRIGTLPPGDTAEVYIPKQPRAGKKQEIGKAQGDPSPACQLERISDPHLPLRELVAKYGNGLRVATDSVTCLFALTNSHTRPSKLSDMVYATLQLIARERDVGLSMVDLGKKSGYDQKTCFYLVKQLIELDLVLKLRRGGNSMNFCIHKYFYQNSPLWKRVREEEVAADSHSDVEEGNGEEYDPMTKPSTLHFEPMDRRSLTSLALLRSRIVKLLENSKNHVHPLLNIARYIGFHPTSRTDRRFFATRLREIMVEGVIEKVLVPTPRSKGVPCIRLVPPEERSQVPVEPVMLNTVDENEEDMLFEVAARADHDVRLPVNKTITTQILDLLEVVGTAGTTLNELSDNLGSFDKRALELLLTRLEKRAPPVALADRTVVQVMENFGRERRHRYFTQVHYTALLAKEGIEDASKQGPSDAPEHTGEFMEVTEEDFYQDMTALSGYQDGLVAKPKRKKSEVTKRKKTTPAKEKKEKQWVNPILPDGTRKRGRPRKDGDANRTPASDPSISQVKQRGRKRKQAIVESVGDETREQEDEGMPPRKRGKKAVTVQNSLVESREDPEATGVSSQVQASAQEWTRTDSPAIANETAPLPLNSGLAESEVAMSDVAALEITLAQSKPSRRGKKRKASRDAAESRKATPKKSCLRRTFEEVPVNDERLYVESTTQATPASAQTRRSEDTAVVDLNSTNSCELDLPNVSVERISSHAVSSPIRPDGAGGIPIDPTLVSSDQIEDSGASKASVLRPQAKIRVQTKEAEGSRKNLSMARRENEFLRLLEVHNGIMNTSGRVFQDAHTTLLDKLASNKEPTSAPPGTRTDRRTMQATLQNLENKGRIKVLTTMAPLGTSSDAMVKIAYLPSVKQEDIDLFLSSISATTTPVTPRVKRMELDVQKPVLTRSSNHAKALDWLQNDRAPGEEDFDRNTDRAKRLFSEPDEVIREALLLEKQTGSQRLGYVVGSQQRLQRLHIHLLGLFVNDIEDPWVLSKEHRVIDFQYFEHSLPLALLCQIVMTLGFDDKILRMLEDESKRDTPIILLPNAIKATLTVGHWRLRRRMAQLLQGLTGLGVVTPLRRVDSPDPRICFTTPGGEIVALDPCAFDLKDPPSHIRVNTVAPIYSIADAKLPPQFITDLPLLTPEQGHVFWEELRQCSLDVGYARSCTGTSTMLVSVVPLHYSQPTITALKRINHWRDTYALSWYQQQYLKQFVDMTTGSTPVDDDSHDTIRRISHVISAPIDAIRRYFSAQETYDNVLDKASRRAAVAERSELSRKRREQKENLSKLAAEARQHRADHWDGLVEGCLEEHNRQDVEESVSVRLNRLKRTFLHGNVVRDDGYWIEEITRVLVSQRKTATSQKLFHGRSRPYDPPMLPPVQPDPKHTIDDLINIQGTIMRSFDACTPSKAKKKRKKPGDVDTSTDDIVPDSKSRRRRFQWTTEFDELLLDAAAIIKSRCRGNRLDWGALEQVFPHIPRNSARQRIVHLRETPGTDAYLKRLEDCWHDMWTKHRDTTYLPDIDWQHATNFDLVKHIEFLRKYINKSAIRVGFTISVDKHAIQLPEDVAYIAANWDIDESPVTNTPCNDFLWSSQADETREKTFLLDAFTSDCPHEHSEEGVSDPVRLAEAALKMVLGTPNTSYDEDQASSLLRSVGDETLVISASERLLERGILSKVIQDKTRERPGRSLRISDSNQSTLGGPFVQDLFLDAFQCEESYKAAERQWSDWPIVATDGDLAALLQMVSDHEIKFDFETGHARSKRDELDWNSKKADDDDIEIRVAFRVCDDPDDTVLSSGVDALRPTAVSVASVIDVASSNHGVTHMGDLACCSANGEGVVNCKTCLDETRRQWLDEMDTKEQSAVMQALDYINNASHEGRALSEAVNVVGGHIINLLHEQQEAQPVALVHVVGYASPRLISADYIHVWTVQIHEQNTMNVFPRRWKDIHGEVIGDIWLAGCRAVVGSLFIRPGTSLHDLRWYLRSNYDKQELNELLAFLERGGIIECKVPGCESSATGSHFGLLDTGEEQRTFLFVGRHRRWYAIAGEEK